MFFGVCFNIHKIFFSEYEKLDAKKKARQKKASKIIPKGRRKDANLDIIKNEELEKIFTRNLGSNQQRPVNSILLNIQIWIRF